MPKTRKGQLAVEQRTVSSSGKKDAKSLAREEEKENIGEQTSESRPHRRRGILGPSTTSGISRVGAKAFSKGKGRRNQVTEKLPLQDITSQFLLAPEFANRGEGTNSNEHISSIHELSYQTMTVPDISHPRDLLSSPLPPSSPPPDLVLSLVKPSHLKFKSLDNHDDDVQPDKPSWLDEDGGPSPDIENDQQHTSSSSDPFGFTALEKKLKGERKLVTNELIDVDDDIYGELHEIPVADTSSPRHVGRIKQSSTRLRGKYSPDFQDQAIEGLLNLTAHPHFSTPPTPHKTKDIRRRHSCEGHSIFSPCSSFPESSPSPTKTSANKRHRAISHGQEPLEELDALVDESDHDSIINDKPLSKRHRQILQKPDDGHHHTIARNLRPRPPVAEKVKVIPRPSKVVPGAKLSRKAKSISSKKVSDANIGDCEKTFKRERQERIKYFDRLADYSVEKENVYII